ncbi:hypothetical protein T11_5193 [Trichinella zimbabwensis]|uniref:Uncharacterized protein n=1 Tax=Trichinella zimbabwensis TaxID=268475 RepID=A0A0V1GVK2_9BILA|nr:hypothetical protein T11_5193 [Trichinella zimbabwensis]
MRDHNKGKAKAYERQTKEGLLMLMLMANIQKKLNIGGYFLDMMERQSEFRVAKMTDWYGLKIDIGLSVYNPEVLIFLALYPPCCLYHLRSFYNLHAVIVQSPNCPMYK